MSKPDDELPFHCSFVLNDQLQNNEYCLDEQAHVVASEFVM
jgi:hypothetical protein